jgi:hypothetical protein
MTPMPLLVALLLQDAPVIEEIRPSKAGPGARIRIRGRGLARPGVQTWIRFAPDLWVEAEEARPDEIVLKLPRGVETGSLRLRVGGAFAEPRPLEIVQDFDIPPPPQAVVRDPDGFAVTTTCDLNVRFQDDHGLAEAEALAKKHGGTVAGCISGLNLFTLRFPGLDLKGLMELGKTLEKAPGVRSATIKIGLRPQ